MDERTHTRAISPWRRLGVTGTLAGLLLLASAVFVPALAFAFAFAFAELTTSPTAAATTLAEADPAAAEAMRRDRGDELPTGGLSVETETLEQTPARAQAGTILRQHAPVAPAKAPDTGGVSWTPQAAHLKLEDAPEVADVPVEATGPGDTGDGPTAIEEGGDQQILAAAANDPGHQPFGSYTGGKPLAAPVTQNTDGDGLPSAEDLQAQRQQVQERRDSGREALDAASEQAEAANAAYTRLAATRFEQAQRDDYRLDPVRPQLRAEEDTARTAVREAADAVDPLRAVANAQDLQLHTLDAHLEAEAAYRENGGVAAALEADPAALWSDRPDIVRARADYAALRDHLRFYAAPAADADGDPATTSDPGEYSRTTFPFQNYQQETNPRLRRLLAEAARRGVLAEVAATALLERDGTNRDDQHDREYQAALDAARMALASAGNYYDANTTASLRPIKALEHDAVPGWYYAGVVDNLQYTGDDGLVEAHDQDSVRWRPVQRGGSSAYVPAPRRTGTRYPDLTTSTETVQYSLNDRPVLIQRAHFGGSSPDVITEINYRQEAGPADGDGTP